MNERVLLEMVEMVNTRVMRAALDNAISRSYGADCAVLLGAVPALADVLGGVGLVFIGGHEDATTKEASATGEAAKLEVASGSA